MRVKGEVTEDTKRKAESAVVAKWNRSHRRRPAKRADPPSGRDEGSKRSDQTDEDESGKRDMGRARNESGKGMRVGGGLHKTQRQRRLDQMDDAEIRKGGSPVRQKGGVGRELEKVPRSKTGCAV